MGVIPSNGFGTTELDLAARKGEQSSVALAGCDATGPIVGAHYDQPDSCLITVRVDRSDMPSVTMGSIARLIILANKK